MNDLSLSQILKARLRLNVAHIHLPAQPPAGHDPLGELQRNLRVLGPTWAEAQQRATGFGIEYHYDLLG